MSNLYAIITGDDQDVTSLGFGKRSAKSDGETAVKLLDEGFPKGYVTGHYCAVESGGKWSLVKKSASKIKAVDDAKKDAMKPKHLDEFMALDGSEPKALEIMLKYLQAQHG